MKVLGDETLRTIAQELVETVRRNATIDWTVRERKGRDEERGPASTEEARVPAGQGEEGDRHSDRAGRVAVRGMDKHLKSRVDPRGTGPDANSEA